LRQWTFSSVGFETHGKQTRRHRFLTEMDAIVPWRRLFRLIEPHYFKGNRGRPLIGIDRMLLIYFLQLWFNLSDPGVEHALYDSAAMRDQRTQSSLDRIIIQFSDQARIRPRRSFWRVRVNSCPSVRSKLITLARCHNSASQMTTKTMGLYRCLRVPLRSVRGGPHPADFFQARGF
jgi:hypothetical protein